jgi:type VI protein secretion system component VasK
MFTALVNIFAFLSGLGSTLFVATPFGRAAMFDLACYFVAPVLYVLNYKKFTSAERRLLLLAALWLIGAIWSNWWRQEPFDENDSANRGSD